MRSHFTLLSGLFLCFFVGVFQDAYSDSDSLFHARQQGYIASGLANFDDNAIVIQAFQGLPVDTPSLQAYLAGISADATSDFTIEQLVRVLYFSNGAYDSMIMPVLRASPYWVNYGDTVRCFWSENHMAQWMSSNWLLHERYGVYADSNLRTRLVHYLNLKIQFGYYEFYSTVYNPYCLAGLLNLADFSQDTVVKNLAIQASLKLMEDFITLTNDKGVSFPTAGRNYSDKYDNAYGQNHNDIIWLLTGLGPQPVGSSHGGSFLSTSGIPIGPVINTWRATMDTLYYRGHSLDAGYAMNSYLDSLDRIVFQWSAGEYFVPEYAEASFVLISDSDLWHNSVFSVFEPLSGLPASSIPGVATSLSVASYSSTLCTDTLAIFKNTSVTLSSVQDYWPGKWGYQQYPCVASIETTAVFTASGTVDSVWGNRSSDNENDDLPYVKQVKNVALEMYWADPKSALLGVSNHSVSLHWRAYDFTEIRSDSLWLLGRLDNNYVGVRRSQVNQINGVWAYNPTDVPGQSWVIIVGDSAMYGSFNNFQAIIDSSQFIDTWRYDTAAMQEVYYAQIIIDGDTINHAWAKDSAMSTGINAIAHDASGLNVYPNPANNILNITMDKPSAEGKIEVYNTVGELVYQSIATDKDISIPTSQWNDGLYAVRVSSPSGAATKCFAISH
jgi:hypothetical protein